ncbi:Uncharacterized protein Adt_13440 [Abeliophyllum distichum]|uniref:Uncharacterized protein n=1 Tax=Abeliophyllum distichum TaxID=126358 RepID=A0ABD1TXA7_9LAMI
MEGTGKSGGDFKKSKPEDMDYEEEGEFLSDGEPEGNKKKKQKKDLSYLPTENKREMALTTRQRALLSKDASSASGASQIEFPNGLPPAPPRSEYIYLFFLSGLFDNFLAFCRSICLTFICKFHMLQSKRKKLSEMEQQLKKAEIAQRRRMQTSTWGKQKTTSEPQRQVLQPEQCPPVAAL